MRVRGAIAGGVLSSLLAAGPALAGPAYRYFVTGNPRDVVTPTRGLLVLQGGGDDVDHNYAAMGDAAGGGDFVVLRASGADEYNRYVYDRCRCDSVATLVFAERKASFDPFVLSVLRDAEAVFIAGGDQLNYVKFWKDTPVAEAVARVAAKPAPVGGSSAGMAVMGGFVYSTPTDSSLTSKEGLLDPFHRDIRLDRDVLRLPRLAGTLTDQHLQDRDRIGRTVALLARLVQERWTDQVRAIAADRKTALHIDPRDGSARVHATPDHPTPFVYFLEAPGPPQACRPRRPLTYRDVPVYRIGPGGRFDLSRWRGEGGVSYTLSVVDGVLTSSRGEIY
jgi:cyanophycinase-like exopeptidase